MKKITTKDIPLDDPYVYKFIGLGNTSGIFQIESAGMQGLMKQMFADVARKIDKIEKKYKCSGFNPVAYNGKEKDVEVIAVIKENFLTEMKIFGKELFERIIAAISLYRPGPMDYIPDYIKGMNDPESIEYDTPEVEEILSGTYGVIVYQEQVQQIVRKLAGYSLGRGDLIRRAMGKKKTKIMDAEKEVFLHGNKDSMKEGEAYVPGCIENGISEEAAIKIWDKMALFALYAFNKSHSAGYAVITIQTAWLKFYYPIDFMAATLNSVISKQDKLKFYIADAQKMGIEILGPDVNKSQRLYTIEGNSIRTGLMGLRNLGKMARPIIEERSKNGPFKNLDDFIDRLLADIDKRMLESLIYSGGLDCFKGTRKSKINSVPDIVDFIKDIKKGLFSEIFFKLPLVDKIYLKLKEIKIEELDEFDSEYILEKEYEYAGMFISGHPLDKYQDLLKANNVVQISDIIPEEDELGFEKNYSVYDGQLVMVAGIIRDLKPITTKKGDKMYMCSIEDKAASIRCVIFPKVAFACAELIQEKKLVAFEGIVNDNEKGCQIVVNNIKDMSELDLLSVKKLYINCSDDLTLNDELATFIKDNPGSVITRIKLKKQWVQSEVPFNLSWANLLKLKEKYPIEIT